MNEKMNGGISTMQGIFCRLPFQKGSITAKPLRHKALAAASFLSTHDRMNDPTQFEQVDETCEFGGAVLYSESLGITAFFENAVPSKYETQKLKQLQFGIENEKIRQFEHECLIRLFQWSFLPPGKALDFSVCDEAFGCYKTQYRKRYLLEICQNTSFLSTPDICARLFVWRFLFTQL